MPDQPFTIEVSYTQPVIQRRTITVTAPSPEMAEGVARDTVRNEDPTRFVLSARRVVAS